MAKKVMQIDMHEDGSIQVLDAVKTEAAGKPIKAEETNWKNFHGYLKKNEKKDVVADAQFTIIITGPCCWIYFAMEWWRICWE